jgi:hypothetical protein
MEHTLRFQQERIHFWADRYLELNSDQQRENIIAGEISQRTHQVGFYNKLDFLEVCRWKSPRTHARCEENDEAYVREVTGIGLSTQNEQLRIEILTLLRGVSWPTASVLLHFGHRDPYPILDFHARHR